MDKGTLAIKGEDNIMIAIDKKKKGNIKDGNKEIPLSYGKHKFSFSKPGFFDLDTSIVLKQSYQEFAVDLRPIKLEVALGLPFPERDFKIKIRSSRKSYQLKFEKGRFYDFDEPNIRVDDNNVIHFINEEIGEYSFYFYTPGRILNEQSFILTGNTNDFYQVTFKQPTSSQIVSPKRLLFPGSNQRYVGYNRTGWFFTFSSLAALVYSTYSYNESIKFLDEYKDARVAYEALQDADQSVMNQHRSIAQDKYNLYAKYRNHSMASNSALLGLGAASFLHVAWVIRF